MATPRFGSSEPRSVAANVSAACFTITYIAVPTTAGHFITLVGEIVPLVLGALTIITTRSVLNQRFIVWFSGVLAIAATVMLFAVQVSSLEFTTFLRGGLVVIAISQCLRNAVHVELAIGWLGFAGFLASSLMLIDGWRVLLTTIDLRYASTLRQGAQFVGGNPSITAMNLAVAFMACQYFAWIKGRGPGLLAKIAWWSGSAVIVLGVFTTGSRKALLACAVFLIVAALQRSPILSIVAVAIVYGIFELTQHIPWMYRVIGHRFLGDESDLSDQSRVVAAQETLDAFGANPLGVGFGGSGRWLSELGYSHSNYLEVLVSIGALGLIVFYWLHIAILRRSLQSGAPFSRYVFPVMLACLFLDVTQVTYFYRIPIFVLALCSLIVSDTRFLSDSTAGARPAP